MFNVWHGVLQLTHSLIALEAFPEAGLEVDAWRCLLYGDLYELAPKDFVDPEPRTSPAPDSLSNVKAPPGFKYRRLNPEGFEVTVDVFDIAGRCYPDLLSAGWFSDCPAPGKVVAGENTKAIVGLRAESVTPPQDCTWKGELLNAGRS